MINIVLLSGSGHNYTNWFMRPFGVRSLQVTDVETAELWTHVGVEPTLLDCETSVLPLTLMARCTYYVTSLLPCHNIQMVPVCGPEGIRTPNTSMPY